MKEKVLNKIKEYYDKTGGNCGLTLPKLCKELECDYKELKTCTRELYKEGLITVGNGVHGKIIKHNPKKM